MIRQLANERSQNWIRIVAYQNCVKEPLIYCISTGMYKCNALLCMHGLCKMSQFCFFVELLIKNTFGPFTLAYILYFLNWIWLVLHKDTKYQKHLNHKKLHLFWHFSKMIVFYDHVGAKFKWNTQKFIHFHFRKFLNGIFWTPFQYRVTPKFQFCQALVEHHVSSLFI